MFLQNSESGFYCQLDTSKLIEECKGKHLIDMIELVDEIQTFNGQTEILVLMTFYKHRKYT
jgi:hypothetical protein